MRRVGKKHNHSIKIKAKVRARGSRSHNWHSEQRVQFIKKKARAQSLWNLHLAGDSLYIAETMPTESQQHLMRSMLIANLAVDQRFANGTTSISYK